VTIELKPARQQEFALHLRIPGWCHQWITLVNDEPTAPEPTNGYIAIRRTWRAGDRVTLNLSMPVEAVHAHPHVRQMQGRIALRRGPIVYCLEGVDNRFANLDRVAVDPPDLTGFNTAHRPELLGGVTVIEGRAALTDDSGWENTLYRTAAPEEKPISIRAVPYCTWDNRSAGEMRVWLRRLSRDHLRT
jgi:DUF1680 family protein